MESNQINQLSTDSYSFVLFVEPRPVRYQLTIRQVSTDKEQGETITEIESVFSIRMKQRNEEEVYYTLSFTPPVINGRGADDYDKWQWIFARLFLLNDGLQLVAGKYGEFRRVTHPEFVLKRWEQLVADLKKSYVMHDIQPLIHSMEAGLKQSFKATYQSDVLLNFLFNDIYRSYRAGASVVSDKKIGKHFGNVIMEVEQKKWLEALNGEEKTARIRLDTRWKTESADLPGINDYLAMMIPSSKGKELDYLFLCDGFYEMDITTVKSFIRRAELTIRGTMGDIYKRTDHYVIKKIDDE